MWGAGGDEPRVFAHIPRIHYAMEGDDDDSDSDGVDFSALERKYIDADLRRQLLAAADEEEEEEEEEGYES